MGLLVVENGEKRAEFSKRNKPYMEQSIEPELRLRYENDGWWLYKENKATLRMRKERPFDEALENRFWNILYRFGYQELNKGRDFKISVAKDGGLKKQIDVFAKDSETVIIAECKACAEPTKRPLQKDIAEFASYQKEIANSIRKHYGPNFQPKIIWCFVTDKIRWSDRDEKHAAEHNINVIKDLELIYFEEFSKKLGKAARYQFHAEYLEDQRVPALQDRKVPAIKTRLGGVPAYLFSALPIDILRISFVNHRDLRDPEGAPSYQRIMKPTRLREIGAFLDGGGYFPNTVLLNFHRKPLFEQKAKDDASGIAFGNLILPDRYKSCWVIDGQHRLYGTAYAKEEYEQPLYFIGFDKVEPDEEAKVFVQINSKQDKVSPTLLSALDGEVKWDSDVPKEKLAAIASRAIDILNSRGGGPWEGKVVSPGIAGAANQPLSLRSIQIAINQSGLVGTINPRTGEIIGGPCWDTNSSSTLKRLVALLELHFESVQGANPARWAAGKSGYLCMNYGVGSHIRLISELIAYVAHKEGFISAASEVEDLYDEIKPYVEKVLTYVRDAGDAEFESRFKVVFGSTGYQEYFFAMVDIVREFEPNFKPVGFEEYQRTSSDDQTRWADVQVKWIQSVVHEYVIDKLKLRYGPSFFEEGVPREIQKASQAKRIDDDDNKLPVEAYLDFIQLESIVSQKEIREDVSDVLSIPLSGEKPGKHFYADWFKQINRIRRVPAHPTGRSYTDRDLETLQEVAQHLHQTLPGKYLESAPQEVIP